MAMLPSNGNANNQDTGSILDVIREQTTNIEAHSNAHATEQAISDALRELASKERTVRESSITIRNTLELSSNPIAEIIEQEWVTRREQAPVSYWQDKTHSFVQFINAATKQVFLEYLLSLKTKEPDNKLNKLASLIEAPNSLGHGITRKEVRLEITNVRANIKAEIIDKMLEKVKTPNSSISQIREGKLHGPPGNQTRSLMLRVNSKGFNTIFVNLNGVLPYTRTETSTKIRLYPRINARPWTCRDCFFIGPNHTCMGKACAQCGSREHPTKDCKSKTRFCTNCKKRGHKAKDAHCPIYVREIVKEIKRMDIPLEFIEEEDKRHQLTKSLIYK